jgi:hypothetical protein
MFRERFGAPSALVASGGAAANGAIRAALLSLAAEDSLPLVLPPLALCTDNGAMIAWAGAERLAYGLCDTLDTAPRARWPLAQVSRPGPRETGELGNLGAPSALPDADETPAVPAETPAQELETATQAPETGEADAEMQAAQPLSPPAGEGQGGPATSSEPAAGPPPQHSPASGGGGAGEPAATEGATTPAQSAPATSERRIATDAVSGEPSAKPDQPSEPDTTAHLAMPEAKPSAAA